MIGFVMYGSEMRSIDSYRYAYLCRFHSLYAWGRGTTRQLEMISSPTSREAFGFIDSVTLRVFSSSGSLVSQGIPPFSPFCSKTHWWTMIICPEYNLYIYGVKKHGRFDQIWLYTMKPIQQERLVPELRGKMSFLFWGRCKRVGAILVSESLTHSIHEWCGVHLPRLGSFCMVNRGKYAVHGWYLYVNDMDWKNL